MFVTCWQYTLIGLEILWFNTDLIVQNTTESLQKQLSENIRQVCLKHRHLASQYTFGMQVDMILTEENHRVLYGEIPKCASSILKKLMVVVSNRMENFTMKNLTCLRELKDDGSDAIKRTKNAFLNIIHEETYIKQVKQGLSTVHIE